MSIPVGLDELPEVASAYGDAPFVITVGDDGRPHLAQLTVAWRGTSFDVVPGRRGAANVAARPTVVVLWPPVDDGGMSLIVDGDARLDGDRVVVTPTWAVKHRPAPER
jgi:hypothetical protein